MRHQLSAKTWKVLAARGGLGLILGLACVALLIRASAPPRWGIACLVSPFEVVASILAALGLYAFLDGIFSILLGFQDYGKQGIWWSLILEGAASIALGAWMWIRPQSPAVLVLLGWIAAWALWTGLLEIQQALGHGDYPERRGPFLAAGLVSVAFGVILLFFRPAGLGLVALVGAYAFLFAWPLLALALGLRRFAGRAHSPEGPHDPQR